MSTLSQFASGGIKSVQRGIFGAAGTVTITAVDTAKTIVYSTSKGSAGTVAASGNINLSPSSSGNGVPIYTGSGASGGYSPTYSGAITGGTTSGLYSGQYSAVLTNSTTLTADGACQYQVVEYY